MALTFMTANFITLNFMALTFHIFCSEVLSWGTQREYQTLTYYPTSFHSVIRSYNFQHYQTGKQ